MLVLMVTKGPDKGLVVRRRDDEPVLVGRCCRDVALDDPKLSRKHAELRVINGRWHIRDLKSTNGTCVNQVRIGDYFPLKDGDLIELGESLVTCCRVADPPDNTMDVELLDETAMQGLEPCDLPEGAMASVDAPVDPSQDTDAAAVAETGPAVAHEPVAEAEPAAKPLTARSAKGEEVPYDAWQSAIEEQITRAAEEPFDDDDLELDDTSVDADAEPMRR